ncbi:hypothetical protein DET54_12548 [Paenibacillus pabuli]|uniref:Uncharacterized protein n=1 Tax=Paenibacillus pabuli TaxID=1472 RepID=A0A855YHH0_9BACL|nr:hypothetical protein DET56_101692 [Paenibacillus pabuli]PXW11820.1 hypothetical protein DEU73_101691 [Paenibacillus taichungensis]RAI84470.1 hypothetical protein DET54_12548 [Paenibacillus pabuli]
MEMSLLQQLNGIQYEKSLEELERILITFLKEQKMNEGTWKHRIK